MNNRTSSVIIPHSLYEELKEELRGSPNISQSVNVLMLILKWSIEDIEPNYEDKLMLKEYIDVQGVRNGRQE